MIQRKQRIPMRDLSTMAPEHREAVEKNSMNGRIFNIFKVLAHHPKLVKRWTPFAGHILGKQTLPFRDRELLILRIGWLNQAEYEFAQHELIAKRGGVSDADVTRLKDGPKAAGWMASARSLVLPVYSDWCSGSFRSTTSACCIRGCCNPLPLGSETATLGTRCSSVSSITLISFEKLRRFARLRCMICRKSSSSI